MQSREPVYSRKRSLASGIPLGGLGTGSVELRPDGRFHDWEIFNNYQWSGSRQWPPPVMYSEDAFFAVRTRREGENARIRLLYDDDKRALAASSQHEYTPVYTFPFVKNIAGLTFRPRYPFVVLDYQDDALPVSLACEAFTPFIPFNGKDSGLPIAFFTFTMANKGSKPCDASLMLSMRNCAGYDLESLQMCHTVHRERGAVSVAMGTEGVDQLHRTWGSSVISVFDAKATWLSAWTDDRGLTGFENAHTPGYGQLFHALRDTGNLPGTSEPWRRSETRTSAPENGTPGGRDTTHHWRGAVCVKRHLKAHQETTVVFALSWHFPNHYHYQHPQVRLGHMYENWFNDAGEVMTYGKKRYTFLRSESRRFCDSLYRGLAPWFAASLNAQLTTFPQVFWWTRSGEFAIWEGSACCQLLLNAHTIWSSFQPLLFFPDIYLSMKKRMGGIDGAQIAHYRESMPLTWCRLAPRQEIVRQQRKDLGGWLPERYRREGYTEEDFHPRPPQTGAPSGKPVPRRTGNQWGGSAQLLRDYLWSGDGELLEMAWPAVRDGLRSAMWQDRDGDGLLDGAVSWLTYDHWFVPGLNCYRNTLWLCEVACGAELARIMNDCEAEAEFRDVLARGTTAFEKVLWNGEYYDLCRDEKKGGNDPGCMAEQVSGNLYVRLCGLEPLHERTHVRSALKAVYRYNRRDEEGLLNGADPRGPRTDWTYFARYSQHGDDEKWGGQWVTPWTGTEYYVAAVMLAEGLATEGMRVARDVYDRHVDFGLLYNHIECGEHYFRPTVLWAMLPALQGLVFDKRLKRLKAAPRVKPDDHDSPLILPGVWGRLQQSRSGSSAVYTVSVDEGTLQLRTLEFELPRRRGGAALNVVATSAGTRLNASYTVNAAALTIHLANVVTLRKGERVEIVCSWRKT